MGKVTNLPSVRSGQTDVARTARRWWRRALTDAVDHTTLPQALSDVGILALTHLARRLTDKRTPDTVKDEIALAMSSKKIVVKVGAPALPAPSPQPTLDDYAPQRRGADVLAAYTVESE